jgi:hypothetical protein
MFRSPPTKAPAAFVCDRAFLESTCEGLPFYREHGGKRYCVLHYPGKDKSAAFAEALGRKVNAGDFDFRKVWFPDAANFNSLVFTTSADFESAIFSAGVDFSYAAFDKKVNFSYTTFSAGVNFSYAIFDDNSSLTFDFARIEKPDGFVFHTVTLRPHWFVNVDARKFEFINVDWNWRDTKQEIRSLKGSLKEEDDLSAHRLLAIACRNLAVNAEENHRYEEASKFRNMAMEARRLERWRGFAFWTLGWWYWLASGYGERVWRAFVVLIGVWLVAAALYTRVGFARWEPRVATQQEAAEARRDEAGAPLSWPRALTYSLGVMTLQKPEPRPATNAAQSLVMLETILGPVQAALLALAIRRKFMR